MLVLWSLYCIIYNTEGKKGVNSILFIFFWSKVKNSNFFFTSPIYNKINLLPHSVALTFRTRIFPITFSINLYIFVTNKDNTTSESDTADYVCAHKLCYSVPLDSRASKRDEMSGMPNVSGCFLVLLRLSHRQNNNPIYTKKTPNFR